MLEPIKSQLATDYESAVSEYGQAFDRAVSRARFQGGASDLTRIGTADLAMFEQLEADLEQKIVDLSQALEHLRHASFLFQEGGLEASAEHSKALWKWHDYQRAVEQYDPLKDTVKAVAEELLIFETLVNAGKRNQVEKHANLWFYRAERLALIVGVSRDRIEQEARDYLEAHPAKYAISTKNLTYKKG